jgi:hypothetical protein
MASLWDRQNPSIHCWLPGRELDSQLTLPAWWWCVQSNLINIAAVLFMWTTLPAFGAAAYVPSIVLERTLFIRCADGVPVCLSVRAAPGRHRLHQRPASF